MNRLRGEFRTNSSNASSLMSIKSIIKLIILVSVGAFMLKGTDGQICRALSFNSEVKNKVLANHTLRTIQPIYGADMCTHQCYMEPLCSSVNYCNKPGETPYCQLIDTDQSRHGADMIDMDGCSFYDTKTDCASNPCPANASCSADYEMEPSKFKCICPKGYEGTFCEKDIDECSTNRHNCPSDSNCTNTIGGFNCTCGCGFQYDGKHCVDINECSSDKFNVIHCDTCTNRPGSFECTCQPAWVVLFDFETGMQGWSTTGTAFDTQPTYRDNTLKRRKGPAKLKGNWWIGGFENCPSPEDEYGRTYGDSHKGMMTSPPFIIRGPELRFLIGGGCTYNHCRAELLIGEKVVRKEKGDCSETMSTKYWKIPQCYHGLKARVRLVDDYSGGWGHINFDHLEGYFC